MVYFKENYNFPKFQEVQHFPGEVQQLIPMETYRAYDFHEGVGSGPLPPSPFGSRHVTVCDYTEMKKKTGN